MKMCVFACNVSWNITVKDNLEEGVKLKLDISYKVTVTILVTLDPPWRGMRVHRILEAICWSKQMNRK